MKSGYQIKSPLLGKHGYVTYVRHSGDDKAVVDAARTSTNGKTQGYLKDMALLDRLFLDMHASPFEEPQLTLQLRCPIFVARQFLRHRSFHWNEESGRYNVSKCQTYTPKRWHYRHDKNRQMSGKELEPDKQKVANDIYNRAINQALAAYTELIALGVSNEEARFCLPLSTYTTLRVTMDLRNLLGFMFLRVADDVQPLTREFARAIVYIARAVFPETVTLFDDFIPMMVPRRFAAAVREQQAVVRTERREHRAMKENMGMLPEPYLSMQATAPTERRAGRGRKREA